jgi:ABC-2 type transport system permease protein
MSVISNSYANVVSSFYNAKFQRHVEELLISPVPNAVILGGYVAGGVVRGLVVGTAVTVVASFFTDFAVHSYAVTVAVFLLTSMLFATAGFVNAVFANSFDDISVIPTFVLTPLTYLGGVFYSVSLLPEVWQRVSFANPVLYMINAFRYGLLGVTDIDLGLAFGLIVAFIVALGGFALWLLDRGIGLKS